MHPSIDLAASGSPLVALVRDRLLPRLPGRIAGYGHRAFRRAELRALAQAGGRTILLATNDLSRSGAPFLVGEMARIVRDAGYTPVVVSSVDGPLARDLRAAGLPVLVDLKLGEGPGWLLQLADGASAAICNTVDTAGVAEALTRSLPTLWYLHEVGLLKSRFADNALRSVLVGVSRVWAGSPLCAQQFVAHRPDVEVVPYGVVPLGPPPVEPARSPLRISVFASVEPRKGQDLAVQAYASLSPAERRSIVLTLYGRTLDRTFAAGVLAQARALGVVHGGELDRAGYADALLRADAVLVPSREDTLPLVSLDALAAGRMLLLAPSVGTVVWLTPGVDSLAAEATSVDGVADLLRAALARAPDAAAIGAAARGTFDAHFSPETFRARLLATVAALMELKS
ncbi:glycosyltransferase [uncultured Sphingomonas sp.]|uniref:glycosyltransferase n=1 Tax=uncultured Sphingomonas sp. TaxID=158754 RepID=UPI0035CA5349